MFCPSCGEKNNLEVKFCRRCGLNLESTAVSLRDQREQGELSPVDREERKLERFGGIAFTGLGIVMGVGVLGLIYAVFENMVLSGRRPFSGVLLMLFIFFAAMTLAYVFWNENLKDKKKRDRPANPALIDHAGGRLTDGAEFEPVPSVTDRTTELLDNSRSRRGVETGKIS